MAAVEKMFMAQMDRRLGTFRKWIWTFCCKLSKLKWKQGRQYKTNHLWEYSVHRRSCSPGLICECSSLIFLFLTSVCIFDDPPIPHQTVQLGHRALASWLTDVPHFDTTLSSSVDMPRRGADGDSAHHLAMIQAVNLTGVAWDSWA